MENLLGLHPSQQLCPLNSTVAGSRKKICLHEPSHRRPTTPASPFSTCLPVLPPPNSSLFAFYRDADKPALSTWVRESRRKRRRKEERKKGLPPPAPIRAGSQIRKQRRNGAIAELALTLALAGGRKRRFTAEEQSQARPRRLRSSAFPFATEQRGRSGPSGKQSCILGWAWGSERQSPRVFPGGRTQTSDSPLTTPSQPVPPLPAICWLAEAAAHPD